MVFPYNRFLFLMCFSSSQFIRLTGWLQTQQSQHCLLKPQDSWYFLFLSPQYESKKRISAEEAMKHSYFRQLGMRIHTLPESEHTHNSTKLQSRLSFCVFFLSSSLVLFAVDWSSPLCCRCIDIHIKRSAAAERPGLQELLVPRVRWVGITFNFLRSFGKL